MTTIHPIRETDRAVMSATREVLQSMPEMHLTHP